MNTSIIFNSLSDIRNLCLSVNEIKEAIDVANLLIFNENGYYIFSNEFLDYLQDNHSFEGSLESLHNILPDVMDQFGTHLEKMYAVKDGSFCCYKIFLT